MSSQIFCPVARGWLQNHCAGQCWPYIQTVRVQIIPLWQLAVLPCCQCPKAFRFFDYYLLPEHCDIRVWPRCQAAILGGSNRAAHRQVLEIADCRTNCPTSSQTKKTIGTFNPTVAYHKHEHRGRSARMFAHVFPWIPAELHENYFAEILLQLHTYACDGTLSSGTLLGFQFETSEGIDHIDSPALWKTFGTSALRNIIVMLSGMKENRQLITDTAATRERSSPWSDTRVILSPINLAHEGRKLLTIDHTNSTTQKDCVAVVLRDGGSVACSLEAADNAIAAGRVIALILTAINLLR